MNTQHETLRLADRLEADQQGIDLGAEGMGWGPSTAIRNQAAAELRRLVELNRQLTEKANRELIRNARLEEANQELLEALRDELEVGFNVAETPTRKRARVLITKHGGAV